jgi:hypothetical protein
VTVVYGDLGSVTSSVACPDCIRLRAELALARERLYAAVIAALEGGACEDCGMGRPKVACSRCSRWLCRDCAPRNDDGVLVCARCSGLPAVIDTIRKEAG